jgi:hypothetical protein
VATNKLPLILADLAYFRSRLSFRRKTLELWDELTNRYRTIEDFPDDQGIERGWSVGTMVVFAIEAGAGEKFMQDVMRLVDEVVADGRWSKLDNYAFRLLFSEMLMRSYELENPRPHEKIANLQEALKMLREFLDKSGVELPVDWRTMQLDEARAVLLNQSRHRDDDN